MSDATKKPKYKDLKFANDTALKLWLNKTAEKILHLLDTGQDLLTIWIDKEGEILHVDAQSTVWTGHFVNVEKMVPGEALYFNDIEAPDVFTEMDFELERVEVLSEHARFAASVGQIALSGDYSTREVLLNGKPLYPGYSLGKRNHSPDGFNWGYGGSGPAQLALAILLEITDDATALKNYQTFKFEVVAALPKHNFHNKVIDVKSYI